MISLSCWNAVVEIVAIGIGAENGIFGFWEKAPG
jgi:hypothetical protein